MKTALGAAATSRDFNAAVDMLVELSSIALADERGQDYLLENPDLVVALGNSETLRRLFEVRTGWPGTRHARLAVAYITDGDTAEAHGHAVRTEEWLLWARDHNEDRPMGQAIRPEDDDNVAIPFYLIAKSRLVNAARYLAQWKGWHAYKLAGRLFELCIVAQALGKLQPMPDMLVMLCRCRKPPPALIAAALSAFPSLDIQSSRKLLVRLTAMLMEPETFDDDYTYYRESGSYRAALIRCALRAVSLGLSTEAIEINRVAYPRRYNFHDLHGPFHAEYIAPWLLSVVARAAAENKQVMLLDCLPIELRQLIQDGEIPQTDEAQERLLRQEIAKPPGATPTSEEKRTQLSAAEWQRAPDYLRERIGPLLTLARHVTDVVRAKATTELDEAISGLFDLWKTVQLQAREGLHFNRELARFLDDLHQACSLQILSALGQVNGKIASRFAERLSMCEFAGVGVRMELVRQLAAHPSGHLAAGKIAVEAVKHVEQEDDVKRRSSLFGELARAILPANASEARTLFRRGLTELDALGSGDYEFTNELLAFSASLRGGPVSSTTAFRLAKICELNNYDSHKSPWPLTGKAFSRVWGLRYLSQITRWHDRDKVDLDLTLPSALTFLIRDRHMAAEDAVPLLGLVDVVEMWDWGWGDIVGSLIDVDADISLVESVLNQYEANRASRSYYRLKDIRAALEAKPEMLARLRPIVDRLQATDAQRRKVDRNSYSEESRSERFAIVREQPNREGMAVPAAASVNPLSTTELEALVVRLEAAETAVDAKLSAFAHLRAGVAYGNRDRHIEAIVGVSNLNLFEKNALLKATKDAWVSDSPSRLAVLQRSGATLIRKHAKELLESNWGFNWELNKVAELSGESRAELAINLVGAATTREMNAAATTWMNLANILSASAESSVPRKALERLLDSGAARLADGVGDGPWRSELDPGDDPAKVVAGLVWYCLGSPDATQRWRAAHVARDFAPVDFH